MHLPHFVNLLAFCLQISSLFKAVVSNLRQNQYESLHTIKNKQPADNIM